VTPLNKCIYAKTIICCDFNQLDSIRMYQHTKANTLVGGRTILSKLPCFWNIAASSSSEVLNGKFLTSITWLLLLDFSFLLEANSSNAATLTPDLDRYFFVSPMTYASPRARRVARSSASLSSNSPLLIPFFLAMFSAT
jgi:hypothetical protein